MYIICIYSYFVLLILQQKWPSEKIVFWHRESHPKVVGKCGFVHQQCDPPKPKKTNQPILKMSTLHPNKTVGDFTPPFSATTYPTTNENSRHETLCWIWMLCFDHLTIFDAMFLRFRSAGHERVPGCRIDQENITLWQPTYGDLILVRQT